MKTSIKILILLLFVSCGSRKVKKDYKLILNERKEVLFDNSTITSNTDFNITELTYEPVDKSKPMVVNGKEYINTKVIKSNNNSKNITVVKKDIELKTESKEKIKIKNKEIQTNNVVIWVAVIIIIVIIIVLFKKKFKFV